MFEFWSSLGYATLDKGIRKTLVDLASEPYSRQNQAPLEIQYFLASEGIDLRMSLVESCLLAHFFQQKGLKGLLKKLESKLKYKQYYREIDFAKDKEICAVIALMMIDESFRCDVAYFADIPHGVMHYLSGKTIYCPLSFDIAREAENFLINAGKSQDARDLMGEITTKMWKPGPISNIAYCPEGVIFLEGQTIPCVEPGQFQEFVGRYSRARQVKREDVFRDEVLHALNEALDEVLKKHGITELWGGPEYLAKAAPITQLAVARERQPVPQN